MSGAMEDPRIVRVLETLKSGDGARLEAICHPDLVIEDPASLPYGGVFHGFAGMLELAGGLFSTVADCQVMTEKVIGDPAGDDFVMVQRMVGKVARTGRPLEMSILEHYSFRDGLLIGIKPYYWDTKALLDLYEEAPQ